jgi:hypothetical protein
MSPFGMLHTAISVLPIGLGLVAFARHGAIDPRTRTGRWYLYTMLAGSVSSFGFILTKGFTPAQVLMLLTLALLVIGTLDLRGAWRVPGFVQALALSASYLLLMVFATTETLTRVPVGQPFASGPDDPALIPVRLVLLATFVIGLGYQFFKLRAANRPEARLQRLVAGVRRAA